MRERHLKTSPFPAFAIDPHVAVTVDDPARPEVLVDLQQNVLRMRFQQDAPFSHDLSPTFQHGDHDFVDHECLRLDSQLFNQLDKEWWIIRTFEVSSVESEKGDEKSLLSKRTGSSLPYQKTSSVVAIAVRETESIGEVSELFAIDVRQVSRDFDAVLNVLPPESSIETRDASREMQFDEMSRNIRQGFCCEHRPSGGGRRNFDWLAEREGMDFIQMLDLGACPSLRVNQEPYSIWSNVEL